MPKHEFLTPKAIANRIKAKGLQKLRWYCQMCQKQCRDENGFQCHIRSESHQRQMALFSETPDTFMHGYSKQFLDDFIKLLSRRWGTKRVHANLVYQEYISDRHHLHMNSTRWETLTDFAKYLGREGICHVEETPKGWFISWIDNSPKALARKEAIMKKERQEQEDEERSRRMIEEQIERATTEAATHGLLETEYTALDRETEEEKIKLNLSLTKSAVPIITSDDKDGDDTSTSKGELVTPEGLSSKPAASISFNKPVQKMSLSALMKKSNPLATTSKKEKDKDAEKNRSMTQMEMIILEETRKKEVLARKAERNNGKRIESLRDRDSGDRTHPRDDVNRGKRPRDDNGDRYKEFGEREKDYRDRDRDRDRGYYEKDRKRNHDRDREYEYDRDQGYEREQKRGRRDRV